MATVVFLHGWGLGQRVFDDLAAALVPRHRGLLLDLAGYGDAPECEPYALEQLAADVASRAPERCCVAGWSLGAQVALQWARARPAQVERLALIGATPCFVQRADWKPAVDPQVFECFAADVTREREATLQRFFALQARGDMQNRRVVRALRACLAAQEISSAQVLERGLEILLQSDLRETLRDVAQHALVVHGENDELVPLAAAQALAGTLAYARLEVVPGAAHAPFVSDCERVARALVEFFDER